MSPLVREYVTNVTTRFDEDLEASWEVRVGVRVRVTVRVSPNPCQR